MTEVILILGLVCMAVATTGLILALGHQLLGMITMLHGPVFVPSSDDKLTVMLQLPRVKRSSRVLDLGSGDGKVVMAIAKQFSIPVEGVELNPWLAFSSRRRIKAAGFTQQEVVIHRKSFWDVDFSQYDVIFLYGTSYIMKKLEKKVLKEMKPGSQFVSNYFQFPNLKPVKSKKEVHLYQL